MDKNTKKFTTNTHSGTVPANFETAITETGYGKFNMLMLLAGLPCCVSSVFETSTMSFVFPTAQCDLDLKLMDKGMLNAITYIGMISSAVMWGFLADTLGRRKILIYGYTLQGVCDLCAALSPNFTMLMVAKYFAGFITCGPFAVLMSYISEFHSQKYRPIVMMCLGGFFSLASIVLPALAWLILPVRFDLKWQYYELHSWQIFLIVCALPSFVSAVAIMLFPETPKFLMSRGKNREALIVFQKMFRINTGQHTTTTTTTTGYPITQLIEEIQQQDDAIVHRRTATVKDAENDATTRGAAANPPPKAFAAFNRGFTQLAPLFRRPHIGHGILVLSIQFGILLGLNTLRLWLPQLFAMITTFNDSNTAGGSLCDMIEANIEFEQTIVNNTYAINGTTLLKSNCVARTDPSIYFNTMMIGFVTLLGYFFVGFIVNVLGNKNILIYGLLITGACGITLYVAKDSLTMVILTSIYCTVGSICSTSLVAVVVNLFPTSLRTMTVSITMMFGRAGAIIGNLMFPYLLSLGCVPPFLMIGIVVGGAGLLSIALPSMKNIDFK